MENKEEPVVVVLPFAFCLLPFAFLLYFKAWPILLFRFPYKK